MSPVSSKRARSPSPGSPGSKRVQTAGKVLPSRPVRFLIFSDTHSAQLPTILPVCDVLLHCGDLAEDGSPKSIAEALQALGKIKAELKLVIAGNHEVSLDRTFYLSEGGGEADVGKAYALISPEADSEASKNGVTFLEEGTHTFTLSSGASFIIFASPYTPTHGVWAFQYPSGEDRFNYAYETPLWAQNVGTETSVIPNGVDIVMTHGPPQYVLDATSD